MCRLAVSIQSTGSENAGVMAIPRLPWPAVASIWHHLATVKWRLAAAAGIRLGCGVCVSL